MKQKKTLLISGTLNFVVEELTEPLNCSKLNPDHNVNKEGNIVASKMNDTTFKSTLLNDPCIKIGWKRKKYTSRPESKWRLYVLLIFDFLSHPRTLKKKFIEEYPKIGSKYIFCLKWSDVPKNYFYSK
jgi:hypothetical protein